jgi:ABC-2 type transport system permease protein
VIARTRVLSAMRLELQQLGGSRWFVVLTILAAVSFLVLVSLFGLTGSDAPMALIVQDRGPYARRLVQALVDVPHAFRLLPMTAAQAEERLGEGSLVGSITIPESFSAEVASGNTVAIDVQVDNVNVDLVVDVQRALPAAIMGFGRSIGLPGLRVGLRERDLLRKDTPFLAYIAVSGLALDALIVAAILGALGITREWERGTMKLWRLAPGRPDALLLGKVLAAGLVTALALAITTTIVVVGYGVRPFSPWGALVGLVACIGAFTCIGAFLGGLLRRTSPIVPLVFGMAMPLYLDSGALEPTRFDGETIWRLAHLTPLYYAVGFLEWAFHGIEITPEPASVDLAVLLALGACSFLGARALVGAGRLVEGA